MWNRKASAAAALMIGCGAAALACGPFFPWQLLDDRAGTLKATPVNSFGFEVKQLVPAPKDGLKPVESFDDAWISQSGNQQSEAAARELGEAESAGLSNNQILLLQSARKAASGPEVLERGLGLPLAVLHYTAGAVAWHKSDYAFAKQQFVLTQNLPGKEAKLRAVWAAYMLGRIAADAHDESAAADFRYARILARNGAPDPLGLAVASYGEEARLHLHAAEALLDAAGKSVSAPADGQAQVDSDANRFSGSVLPERSAKVFRNEIAAAIGLYADQAARGSDRGVQSLRMVAEFLLDRPDRIEAVASEPVAVRLMMAYALRLTPNNSIDITDYYADDVDLGNQIAYQRRTDVLSNLAAALQKQPHPAGADRLAALCYSLADWRCAERFAAKTDSPLASWVKAKLATQKGDLEGAAKFYAAAVHGFPADRSLEERARKQVIGESGVVALARGDYIEALAKLWPVSGTYWSDVAYLAERVLTVDELKHFVDGYVPPGKAPVVDGKPSPYGTPFDSRVTLRDLLARRLMRAGRFEEAFAYFSDPAVAQAAADFAHAIKDGAHKWGKVDRAEALFKAATIARQSGLEMMGSEGPPDNYYSQGDFEYGLGRDKLEGKFITAGERERFNASNVVPDERFHYRYVAIGLTNAAADLVPERSQAYAAMLCHAVAWSSRDAVRAKALYQRYVKHGAQVPFAKTFGAKCAAPDFKGAIAMERKLMIRDARRYVSHHRWWFAGGGGAGLLAIAGLIAVLVLRRRKPA